MRSECTVGTDTHSEYVILTGSFNTIISTKAPQFYVVRKFPCLVLCAGVDQEVGPFFIFGNK